MVVAHHPVPGLGGNDSDINVLRNAYLCSACAKVGDPEVLLTVEDVAAMRKDLEERGFLVAADAAMHFPSVTPFSERWVAGRIVATLEHLQAEVGRLTAEIAEWEERWEDAGLEVKER
jgi:hypothetical protein